MLTTLLGCHFLEICMLRVGGGGGEASLERYGGAE